MAVSAMLGPSCGFVVNVIECIEAVRIVQAGPAMLVEIGGRERP